MSVPRQTPARSDLVRHREQVLDQTPEVPRKPPRVPDGDRRIAATGYIAHVRLSQAGGTGDLVLGNPSQADRQAQAIPGGRARSRPQNPKLAPGEHAGTATGNTGHVNTQMCRTLHDPRGHDDDLDQQTDRRSPEMRQIRRVPRGPRDRRAIRAGRQPGPSRGRRLEVPRAGRRRTDRRERTGAGRRERTGGPQRRRDAARAKRADANGSRHGRREPRPRPEGGAPAAPGARRRRG